MEKKNLGFVGKKTWVLWEKKPGFCGKTNLGFVGKPEFREKLGGFCGEKNLGLGKKKLVLKNKT